MNRTLPGLLSAFQLPAVTRLPLPAALILGGLGAALPSFTGPALVILTTLWCLALPTVLARAARNRPAWQQCVLLAAPGAAVMMSVVAVTLGMTTLSPGHKALLMLWPLVLHLGLGALMTLMLRFKGRLTPTGMAAALVLIQLSSALAIWGGGANPAMTGLAFDPAISAWGGPATAGAALTLFGGAPRRAWPLLLVFVLSVPSFGPVPGGGGQLRVQAVQGGEVQISQSGKAHALEVTRREELLGHLMKKADLTLMPEQALPGLAGLDKPPAWGKNVVYGRLEQGALGRYNAAFDTSTGRGVRRKIGLVPLQETPALIPGRTDQPQVFGPWAFAVRICLEAMNAPAMRQVTAAGAGLLLVPTNTTNELAYALQMRAVMNVSAALGLPVIMTNETGGSVIAQGNGQVIASLPWGESGAVSAIITRRTTLTPYAVLGAWPLAILAGLIALMGGTGLTRPPKGRTHGNHHH